MGLDFDTAEKEFDAVQKADPHRMEEVDIYSNMLYVMNKKAKLGKLAHEYAEIDRNRAEVCCLIGTPLEPRPSGPGIVSYRGFGSFADWTRKLLFVKGGSYKGDPLF